VSTNNMIKFKSS